MAPLPGDVACNPGMWPDWESDWWPFASQAGTQSTEPHQPGLNIAYFKDLKITNLMSAVTKTTAFLGVCVSSCSATVF